MADLSQFNLGGITAPKPNTARPWEATKPDFNEIDAQLATNIEGRIREWFDGSKVERSGDWWKVGNNGGLKVNATDGHWCDHSEDKSGPGLLSLYAWTFNKTKPDAATKLSNGSNVVAFKPKTSKPKPKPEFELAMTTPEGLPKWWKKPSAQYQYKTREGLFVLEVARFDKDDGSKDILQASWLKDQQGNIGWQFKAAPLDKNLLYRGELLAANPDKPILIVEGEKCVEAVEGLLDDWLVVSWQGGSKTAPNADWSGLDGRRVVIWPDNDEPGTKAADKIKEHLPQAAILTPPTDKSKGWDGADAMVEGFDVVEFVGDAAAQDDDDLFDDISHLWEGDIEFAEPTVGHIGCDKHLFYDSEVNEIHGEAGIAKTWIVLEVMRQEMAKGNHVVYLDPESTAKKIIGRLRSMGVNAAELFHYKSTTFEEETTWLRYQRKVEQLGATVACLDGLVNFIAMRGSSEDDNAEAVKTLQTIAKPLAKGGAAVIVIDHTSKNKTTKGARGAGSKRGFYKGASYHVQSKEAFSKAKSGYATLTVDKDNEGSVGAVGDVVAQFHCTVDDAGSSFALTCPASAGLIASRGARPKMTDDEILALGPVGRENRVPFENIEYVGDRQHFTNRWKKAGGKVENGKHSGLTPKNHFWREE